MGTLTVDAMVRNRKTAEHLGCLDAEGMEMMSKGTSPVITFGPYTGENLTVGHVIPGVVAPSLDRVLADLELMPEKLNLRKGAKIG